MLNFPQKILKSNDKEIPVNLNNDNLRNAWHLIPALKFPTVTNKV